MPETLGVLGGGQLGRYFVLAARAHGFRTVVLEPDRDSPAGKEADEHIVANYDDETALERMAAACTAVTVIYSLEPPSFLIATPGRSCPDPFLAVTQMGTGPQ